jgi:hypothetical protein
MRMTYKQFRVKLRATPRDWFIDDPRALPAGAIVRRTFNDDRGAVLACPITAVAGDGIGRGSVWNFAPSEKGQQPPADLGLSHRTARRIIDAADKRVTRVNGKIVKTYDAKTRAELLADCGLTEAS